MALIYETKENIIKEFVPDDKEASKHPTLSLYVLNFLEKFLKRDSEQERTVEPKIKVSEMLGKVAFFYEKIRNSVDYKNEYVIRRNAVERILRRLVWEKERMRLKSLSTTPLYSEKFTDKIARSLIKEMIWARYLKNNSIPVGKIDEIKQIIAKYLYVVDNLGTVSTDIRKGKLRSWLWGIAASEIEETLDPTEREMYVKFMYEWFSDHFKWEGDTISEHEKKIQIYLAIHRAYPKSDEPIIRFHLLLKEFPRWSNASQVDLDAFLVSLPSFYKEIESHLAFKGKFVLYRKVQKHSAAFDVFWELSREKGAKLPEILLDVPQFEKSIVEVCEKRYKTTKAKVSQGIIRSIIYIFLTKVFLALLIEVPYEVFRYGNIHVMPLTINIIFPPLMMFLISFSIKVPGEENTRVIISRLKSAVYSNPDHFISRFTTTDVRKKTLLAKIFGLLYVVLFMLVFGTTTYLLMRLQFTIFGIFIFFAFLSLVLLFAYRVKFHSSQIKIETDRDGFFDHIVNYLTLPFLNVGFYLSKGFAKFNFFTVILDFLIEAPLKSVIDITGQWSLFVKEKQEEVVERPE
jgi:hypothetical protein